MLLCRRHHTAVHEKGYRVKLGGDGRTSFYGRRGQPIPEAPCLPRLQGDPVAALRRRHAGLGLAIDATTGLPTWDGTPTDLGMAVDGLLAATEQPPRMRKTFPRERVGDAETDSAGAQAGRFDRSQGPSVRRFQERGIPP